MHSEIIGNE